MANPGVAHGNLFANLPTALATEEFATLASSGPTRLVRIVSTGQATPAGEWLDQTDDEWVVLLKGSATLRFEGEPRPRTLAPGDYLHIPAHVRHRVERTDERAPAVWLALYYA
jgi:cupin 2 domain-containing protein